MSRKYWLSQLIKAVVNQRWERLIQTTKYNVMIFINSAKYI